MERLTEYTEQTRGMDADRLIEWAVGRFGTNSLCVASSLGAEDQVITHMVSRVTREIEIFTLDTGRLPQESYDLIERTAAELGVTVQPYAPEAAGVERMVRERGVNLFYRSVENRRLCCAVRKVAPLARALSGRAAWITGLRRLQSVTRTGVEPVQWDEAHRLYKISPLWDWTEEQVWNYIRDHEVPYHALHDRGYRSIGCAPCTRAVQPGEDLRAGRWWWEQPEHRECGLHTASGPAAMQVDRIRP